MKSFNRNANIKTRRDSRGNIRTETLGRRAGFDVAASTNTSSHRTRVFIDLFGRDRGLDPDHAGLADLELTGYQARTLYRVLKKHFESRGN